MLITFLALIVTVLLIMFGGLAFSIAMYRRDSLYRAQQNNRKSQTARLHEIIFM